jgi:hypothetical protein
MPRAQVFITIGFPKELWMVVEWYDYEGVKGVNSPRRLEI